MLDYMLRFSLKKLLVMVVAWVACVVLHNAIYAAFRDFFGPNGDEPFFFLLAVCRHPALRCHIFGLHGVSASSSTWAKYSRLRNRNLPIREVFGISHKPILCKYLIIEPSFFAEWRRHLNLTANSAAPRNCQDGISRSET